MIVADLLCEYKHRFEGWFPSADTLQAQQTAGQVRCPICDTRNIEHLPAMPFVGRRITDRQADTTEQELADAKAVLRTLVQRLEGNAVGHEDPGGDYSVQIIRLGHGDEAGLMSLPSQQELESLLEDSLSLLPAPPAKEDLH